MFSLALEACDPTRTAWRWVALLALLGFPLACDQTPTAPVTGPEASLFGPPVGRTPLFDDSYYSAIDVNAAAQRQYCPTYPWFWCNYVSVTTVSNHLYGWRAVVNGTLYKIDMWRAVVDEYCGGQLSGCGYELGAVGVGTYDWRAVHYSAIPAYEVLPIVPIASDYFYNVSAVQTGLANLESVLLTTQAWYAQAMTTFGGPSKTFRLLQPLIALPNFGLRESCGNPTAAQWNQFNYATPDYTQTANCSDGYVEGALAWEASLDPFGAIWPDKILVAPFAGGSFYTTDLTGGAFDPYWLGNSLAVVAPAASALNCSWGTGGSGLLNNLPCQEETFFVAYELGYTFGLQRSLDGSTSLMAQDFPPQATLTADQINTLTKSGFFF